MDTPLKSKKVTVDLDKDLLEGVVDFKERDRRGSLANAAEALIARGLEYERQNPPRHEAANA